MAPKVEQNRTNRTHFHDNPPRRAVKPPVVSKPPTDEGSAAKRADLTAYGNQQKDRIERLYGAGAASVSTMRDIRLAGATKQANRAYARTYQNELKALGDPASSANPPKNLIDVSLRAETAYRTELGKEGFTPSDVRGTSVVKTADFLRTEAKRPGDFTTLSPSQIKARVAAGEQPQYFVRVMEKSRLSAADAHLSNPNSPHVWLATPEEIAGAKLDGFETMKRVGFSDSYIAQLKASGKTPSDFTLVISEARGVKGQKPPTWNNVLDAAKAHPDFAIFQRKFSDPNFFNKVQSPDYKARFEEMNRLNLRDVQYSRTLPKDERGAFLFRDRMNRKLGVNEFFTGNGRTERTDGRNQGVGVREILGRNDQVSSMQRTTYAELSETGKTNLKITDNTPTIADNPLRLRGEMRTGAAAGGAISAVASLPQVFGQASNGDYSGAAKTLATNTAFGSGVGALSSGGERIVGRQIENALGRSNLAQQGIDRLFTNGAARNVVGRLAQTEASSLTSQTFGTTTRTIAGRIGGAGVIGGVVNGAFSAYDQIGAYKRGEVSGSQAIGTVTGEAAVGVGAGLAGAAAGAAIGSIIPGAGTIVGGVIGFGVGVAAGYLADKGLRGLGVDKAIAKGVTATIDAGSRLAGAVQRRGSQAVQAGRQFVSQQITQAKAVYRSASSAVKSARAFVGQKLDNARQRVSNATRAAVNYVSQVKDRAVQAVRNTASQAINQVRSTVSNVAGRVSSTVNNIADQARSTVSNAVNNVAGGAVNRLKSVFGW